MPRSLNTGTTTESWGIRKFHDAKTGAKLYAETFPTRLERGAGLPAVERIAYLAELAGVQLKVFDKAGQLVLRLKDAGPMTYVQLPQGDYRVTASYMGNRLERMVHVGPKGLDANFHWAI